MQILTPDLSATQEVNLLEMILRDIQRRTASMLAQMETAEIKDEDKDEQEAAFKIARDALDAAEKELAAFQPADDHPHITIGYIHPRKAGSLENRRFLAMRGGWSVKTATLAQLDELTEITREVVKYGVKGHRNMAYPFMTETVRIGSAEIAALPEELLDLYQATKVLGTGLLQVLADEVQQYNTLSEKKRQVSLSPSGTVPVNSTVRSVTPTCESGEDAQSQPKH
jgi:hypothetical protein